MYLKYENIDTMNPGYYVSSDESEPESIPDDWEGSPEGISNFFP